MDFLDQFLLSTSPNPRPTSADHSSYIETRGEMGSIKVSEQDIEERSRKASVYRDLKSLDPLGTEGYRGRRSISASREGDGSPGSRSPTSETAGTLPPVPASPTEMPVINEQIDGGAN